MTDLLHDIDAPSDAELISRVRGGDVAAYGELFSRHVDAARRLARQLMRGPDADDLVSDAFAKVLGVLQGGGGPDVAFRAYLLTAVRRLHVDRIRAGARLQTSDDMEAFDAGVPFQDTAVAAFESGAAAKAFASLPERWQLVLWHLEVEGQKPAEIAPLLGMSANSVSALAYRAREGLRQAFLTMHLNDTSDTSCRWVNEHLGAYVRNGLAKRDAAKVQSHLDECRRCTAMYLELTEVNSNLRGIIAPLLLGAAAAGYLSSTGAAAGGGFGLVAFLGRAREVVTANAGAATAGAVAAGVAAVAAAGIMLLPSAGPEDTVTGADDPIGTVSTPGTPDDEPAPGERSEGPTGPEDGATADDGTAATEEPALDATPDTVPVGDAAAQPSETQTGPDAGSSEPGADGGDQPTAGPTDGPTDGPTGEPTGQPTGTPTGEPTGTPTGEPTQPPVDYRIQVTALKVEDGQVSFDFDGVLPPVVHLAITSEPATVLFTDDGTCEADAAGLHASCALTGTPTLLAPLVRVAAAVAEEPFAADATVGLTAPTEDSEATVTIAADQGGPVLARATFPVKAPVVEPRPDVGLAGFPASVEPTGVHDYLVTGTLTTSDYDGGVAFELGGDKRARFADDAPAGCTRPTDRRLECPDVEAGEVTLPLYVQDNSADTQVTLTATPLDGPDSDATNNQVTVVLERFVPEPVNASVAVTKAQSGNSGKATLTVAVTSSDPTVPVTLTGRFDPAYLAGAGGAPEGCRVVDGSGLDCVAVGNRTYTLDVDVERVKNNARFEDFVFSVSVPETHLDSTPEDDSDSALVERFGPEVGGTGGAGAGSGDPETTADALTPTAGASPVAQTLEATAQTLASLADDVTGVATRATERDPTGKDHASRTEKATGKTSAVRDKSPRAARVKSEASPATRTTGADAVRKQKRDRVPDAKVAKAEKPAAPATRDAEADDGLVDTAVKVVNKIL